MIAFDDGTSLADRNRKKIVYYIPRDRLVLDCIDRSCCHPEIEEKLNNYFMKNKEKLVIVS